ncbi:sulfatase domain-containing protein [Phthorimaea operculella]|nr:sulfatase domain-containing protein [Phthorimaea operculella]
MVADVIETLDSKSLLENTYLIYTSDNGYHIGQFSQVYDKRQPYESDIKVPLLIRGPNLEKNIENHQPVLNIDLAPTVLKLAGLKPLKSMDGHPIDLTTKGMTERSMLVEYHGESKDGTVDSSCRWAYDSENLAWLVIRLYKGPWRAFHSSILKSQEAPTAFSSLCVVRSGFNSCSSVVSKSCPSLALRGFLDRVACPPLNRDVVSYRVINLCFFISLPYPNKSLPAMPPSVRLQMPGLEEQYLRFRRGSMIKDHNLSRTVVQTKSRWSRDLYYHIDQWSRTEQKRPRSHM